MEPHIQYAQTKDGVSIAFNVRGQGTPLLFTPGWISHLEINLGHPQFRAVLEGLAAGGRRQVITYDGRGTGLSDREVEDISIPARVRDIEALVDHLNLTSFVLFAWSMDGPPAIIYTAEHPEKVSHLILYGSFARSFGQRREDLCRALLALMKAEWSVGSKTVVEFTSPGVDKEAADFAAQYFRLSASAEMATGILEEGMFRADITEYLPKLTMPTLVMHRREDSAVSFECGRQLATLIPNSRFVPLPGNAHAPHIGDFQPALQAIDEFLGEGEEEAAGVEPPEAGAFRTILFTDVEGSTALTQRLGDAKARQVLRQHERIVREALKSHRGSELKTMGDGFMASFSSATRALESAIAMQRAFAAHNESAEEPILVRVGLNAGEPIAEEEDLFGTAVNLAARICGHAEAGQILASDVVRQLVAGKDFLFADCGDVALKGFEEPVRLYEVRWQD